MKDTYNKCLSVLHVFFFVIYIVSVTLQFQYVGDSTLFEDEDARTFYETLPDLKSFIPGVRRAYTCNKCYAVHAVTDLLSFLCKYSRSIGEISY